MLIDLPLGEIVVGERARKEVRNIAQLAESIRVLGLLHPVVVNGRRELVAGFRRLAAFRELNRPTIPARVVDSLDDAVLAVTAERAENTCRDPLSPVEIVELGKRLEELEKPAARKRQGARTDLPQPSGKFPEGSKGQTRDKVAAALGVSGRTYEKAKQIVEAAEREPERFGDLPAMADEKSIDAASQELKARRAETGPVRVRVVDPWRDGLRAVESAFATRSRGAFLLSRRKASDRSVALVESLLKKAAKDVADLEKFIAALKAEGAN